MPYRKIPLAEEVIYHVFNKSIAGFTIFNYPREYQRMLDTLAFYTREKTPCKFSLFEKNNPNSKPALELGQEADKMVEIIAFCLMPTHIHLILQQRKQNGISRFMNLALKSYSKYFNKKCGRKGPLWEGRFKNVLIKTQEQFLHLTRYVHLNPVTAYLVDKPQEWDFSSYKEYTNLVKSNEKICNFSNYLGMDGDSYEKFVLDRIEYQRELSLIKHLTLE